MKRFRLVRYDSSESLAHAAALTWLDRVEADLASQAAHYVALSGGRIARYFFSCASVLASTRAINFAQTHFFWADERCVPPEDPESNYRLAWDCLLSRVEVPPSSIHRVQGEKLPELAARLASQDMLRSVPLDEEGYPQLSLVVLGMGEDGHVASLFPDGPSPGGQTGVYQAVSALKPPAFRITLSYSIIQRAREVLVLVSGPAKDQALRHSISEDGTSPLARIIQGRTATCIMTDMPTSVSLSG